MPIVEQAHQAAVAIIDAVQSGNGLRASMHGLSWAEYAPFSVSAYATTTVSESRHFTLLEVSPSGTPATHVAEGVEKPIVAEAHQSEVQLQKYAGRAHVSLECLVYTREAERLLADVVLNQVVQAMDTDLVAAMGAKHTPVTTTAKGSAALLEAQAALLGLGAVPTTVAVNPSDYAKLLSQTANGAFLNFSSAELGTRGLLFGMALVPSAKVPAGTAYVFDGRGLVVAELAESPMLFVSSMSTKNEVDIIVDVFAALAVVSAGAVAEVPLTF